MNINTMFPSKYVSAGDLQGQRVPVMMSHVVMEDVGDGDNKERLPVLYFQGMQKGMVLNKTNAKSIANWYGDDTDYWPGQSIILYSTKVQFGKDMVDGIRVDRDFSRQSALPQPQAAPVQQPAQQALPQPGPAPQQPVAQPAPQQPAPVQQTPVQGGVSF